jgi:hypothetical protein
MHLCTDFCYILPFSAKKQFYNRVKLNKYYVLFFQCCHEMRKMMCDVHNFVELAALVLPSGYKKAYNNGRFLA